MVRALTAREREVLLMIARGKRAADIAEELGISPKTVRRHQENIRGKLGARDRTHAVVLALRTGMFSLEDLELDDDP